MVGMASGISARVQSPAVSADEVSPPDGSFVGVALGAAEFGAAEVSVGLEVGLAIGPQAVVSRSTAPRVAMRGIRFNMQKG
jgi:hypothetical protein